MPIAEVVPDDTPWPRPKGSETRDRGWVEQQIHEWLEPPGPWPEPEVDQGSSNGSDTVLFRELTPHRHRLEPSARRSPVIRASHSLTTTVSAEVGMSVSALVSQVNAKLGISAATTASYT